MLYNLDYLNEQEDIYYFPFKSIVQQSYKPSGKNRFQANRPEGAFICDTVNNPIFPVLKPLIDGSTPNFLRYVDEFKNKYFKTFNGILPWHYLVEFNKGEYVVYNTRPLDLAFPVKSEYLKEIRKEKKFLFDDNVNKIIKNKEISNYISICVMGDSDIDVYTRDIYKKISDFCIRPNFLRYKIGYSINNTILFLNIGSKFKTNMLLK